MAILTSMWSRLLLPKMHSILFLAGAVPYCLAKSQLDTAVTPVHHMTQTIAFQHPTPSRPPHPRQYDAFHSFKGLHKGSKEPRKPPVRPTVDCEIPPGEVRAYSEATAKGVMSRGIFLDKVSVAAMIGTSSGTVILPRSSFAASKRSIEEVKKGVEADFVKGRYYVTGDLTPSLYRPDCLFTDPTTRVSSVKKYTAAVRLLFDPDHAQVDLLSLEVQDNSHIFATWRLQGFLKFPWHPYVAPYTGTTLYTLDSDGLISRHEETWSISALDAALATITPTAGPRAKNSLL